MDMNEFRQLEHAEHRRLTARPVQSLSARISEEQYEAVRAVIEQAMDDEYDSDWYAMKVLGVLGIAVVANPDAS